LIQELCPDGVEYKKLSDIATVSRGGNFQKKDFLTEGVPCIHYGQIYTKYGLFANKTFTFISEECAKKQKKAVHNDIIMAVTSENIEDVCKCVGWLGKSEIAVSGHSAIIHHNQDVKYLVYYFHTQMFFAQKRKLAHGTKVIEVTPDKLLDITIPVPPLPVQREIVRILDSYTERVEQLTAELTAELAARKKQYEYYRDSLLNFDVHGGVISDCEWRTLGEVATIVRGASPRPIKSYLTDDEAGVNWIKIGDTRSGSKYITNTAEKITIEGASKSRYVKPGDFILSNSMSFGRPYIVKTQGCIHDGWLAISDFEDSFIPDFLYHLLSSNKYQQTMRQKASFGGAVQNLNADIVRSIEVPLVSIAVQQRLVHVLDRFDALCNDLSSGLPAEIEARQKQYEYYRDKLLAFKEQ
jgi:type I restriction enzyme S subunit